MQRAKKSVRGPRPRNQKPTIPKPDQFVPTVAVNHRFRFVATAARAADTLTVKSLGDLHCVAATATTAFQLAHFIKIKKIEVWGPPAGTSTTATVSVDWQAPNAGSFGTSGRVSDTSMGSTECAHVVTRPPKGSQIAQWQEASSTNGLCVLAYPLGTIIDVTYSYMMRDDATVQAVTTAPVGATAGANYVRALNSPVDANLVPVSYATI